MKDSTRYDDLINPWWLRNKAMGARWVASSAHPIANIAETGVLGPPPPDAFFITKEDERPWLIVDLGEVEEISRIRVVNRVGAEVRSVPRKHPGRCVRTRLYVRVDPIRARDLAVGKDGETVRPALRRVQRALALTKWPWLERTGSR